jgi:hypothetical protein
MYYSGSEQTHRRGFGATFAVGCVVVAATSPIVGALIPSLSAAATVAFVVALLGFVIGLSCVALMSVVRCVRDNFRRGRTTSRHGASIS